MKKELLNLLLDKKHNLDIYLDNDKNILKSKKTNYIKKNNIYNFFVNEEISDHVTQKQEKFYEEVKFPNYDGLENYSDLLTKSSSTNHFAAILDNSLAYNSKILEVGCGTGQLSLFLKRFNRLIFGIDLSNPSLELANEFKERNEIMNVFFAKMNIFNLQFKDEVFDYVISNGVLHHTYDTEKAFKKILKPLKKNGYIVIGLYHKYGRLYTNFRQFVIRNFGEKFKFLDKRNIDNNISKEKRFAWLKDQYKNPHETSHTLKEVLSWFDKNNIEYISSIPFENVSSDTNIFRKTNRKLKNLFINELLMMFSPSQIKEGGFFVVVGKKLI